MQVMGDPGKLVGALDLGKIQSYRAMGYTVYVVSQNPIKDGLSPEVAGLVEFLTLDDVMSAENYPGSQANRRVHDFINDMDINSSSKVVVFTERGALGFSNLKAESAKEPTGIAKRFYSALVSGKFTVLDEALCIFFTNDVGCFMPLPPLGLSQGRVLEACHAFMEAVNHNPDISRIENIEEAGRGLFEGLGWKLYEKSCDYVVRKSDIAFLRGAKFKHKRNLYNVFCKNHEALFRDYAASDKPGVLALWDRWQKGRIFKHPDPIYKAMLLKESFQEVYLQSTEIDARRCLEAWIEQAMASGLQAFKILAESFREKMEFLLNWFKKKISSAISEGFNNKIKRLKRMAYGYRDAGYFLLKIHQHCGLLNPRTQH